MSRHLNQPQKLENHPAAVAIASVALSFSILFGLILFLAWGAMGIVVLLLSPFKLFL